MGIFDNQAGDIFTRYQATIQIKDRLMGGIPKDPTLMEGWLFGKGVRNEDDRRQFVLRTLAELGYDVPAEATFDEMVETMKGLAELKASGFKCNERGLYIESRQVKAMLKEAVAIVFEDREFKTGRKFKTGARAGEDATKQFRSAFAERVFVDTQRIALLRNGEPVTEPDGVETRVGHVVGPQGPRSTLDRNEYVEQPTLTFQVSVLRDFMTYDDWAQIWRFAQNNGLGAVRSQDYGKFDIIQWDRLEADAATPTVIEPRHSRRVAASA